MGNFRTLNHSLNYSDNVFITFVMWFLIFQQLSEVQRKAAEAMEANEDAKEQARQAFIDELMRRQELNGTFEDTAGEV